MTASESWTLTFFVRVFCANVRVVMRLSESKNFDIVRGPKALSNPPPPFPYHSDLRVDARGRSLSPRENPPHRRTLSEKRFVKTRNPPLRDRLVQKTIYRTIAVFLLQTFYALLVRFRRP